MQSVSFFKKKSFLANNLFQDFKLKKNIKINNIKSLKKAKKFDLTFLTPLDTNHLHLVQKRLAV